MPQNNEGLSLDDAAISEKSTVAQAIALLHEAFKVEKSIPKRLEILGQILSARQAQKQDGQATGQARERMAALYEFDGARTQSQRKKQNREAIALLERIRAGEVDRDNLTLEQKQTLANYSGTGGGLENDDGKKGSQYEFYTPAPIAAGMWDAMADMGFTGGKVLDPCAGTGIFGATAPLNVVMDAVELSQTSGEINELVNGGAGYKVTVSPFEAVVGDLEDESFDAVITNVPFGGLAARGTNAALDKTPEYRQETLENYFILRSLRKLRAGGLAAFICPTACVSGKQGANKRLREKVSYMAEFLGAYRLPNAVFGSAAADVMTDVVFFRKHSRDLAVKIEQLRTDAPEVLEQANILFKPFLDGKYFIGEGKRFVLGTLGKRMDRYGKESEFLNADVKVGELGKMLRRFGDSRINWELLDVTETVGVQYKEGDTLVQDGETLRLEDGLWVPVANAQLAATGAMAQAMLGKFETPLSAFDARVQYSDAQQLQRDLAAQAKLREMPGWVAQVLNECAKTPLDTVNTYWAGGIVGLAVEQVLEVNSGNVGFNYLDGYKALSDAMQTQWGVANGAGGAIGGSLKKGLNAILAQYNKRSGFTAFWRGDVLTEVQQKHTTADSSLDGLRYMTKSKWLGVEQVKQVLGADFDPMQSDDWCISADGQTVTRAADYYVGNYADFLRDLDKQMADAASDEIRDKLLRQKQAAYDRVERVNVSNLEFNLFSPHVTAQEKAQFLRLFVDNRADVVFDDGKGYPAFVIPNAKSDKEKLLNRLNHYLRHTTISLGNAELSMPSASALAELKRMAITANEQFNQWVRSNTAIIDRLQAVADDPEKLRFARVEDGEPIAIPGMNPELELRFYQNAFVRQQAREFGGGNGFDVGLGKTFASLAAVQYVQSIGVKKKTFFVVPNAVASNWKKEASNAFTDTSDCLYVGMREDKDGNVTFDSSNYDADLHSIKENRHSKIFLTFEAFERLRLRTDTIEGFVSFMRKVDVSFAEVDSKKKDEANKAKTLSFSEALADKAGNAPYLEDLGVDSIVVDEAHSFKNNSVVSEFKGGRFLSLSEPAKRGLDMQAKAWYIRGQSPLKDGVMLLTASPITNSPLEIYSMMSLAVGHERVNDMLLGTQGADNFMQMMCNIELQEDMSIDGISREINVFTGLKNVDVLRKLVNSTFNIKDASQVGHAIVMPNSQQQDMPIELPDEIKARLTLYQSAYRFAIDTLNERVPVRGEVEDFEKVSAYFGEPMELIGHPFNLINKMTLLIADPELDQRATFYTFTEDQTQIAKAVVDKFNAKKQTENRKNLSPHTADGSYTTISKKRDDGKTVISYKVKPLAYIQGAGRILIDTTDTNTQSTFEKMAEDAGLGLDVTIPPKVAALIENVKKERANPRGVVGDEVSPIVKQIIFCDTLPLLNKIKRALAKYAGVPSGAIAIVTGQTNNSPDEIMEVQEGFNADGAQNRYQIVLANEKAEVGINLQKGTQAIHHLTIGYTPDSLQQRNGRGVRQGNKTESVTIYYYDADGTFDSHKRTMVSHKANWIEQVMAPDGENSVQIDGGMTNDQYDMLIETMGDVDAMRERQAEIDRQQALKKASTNRERQKINIETIVAQRDFLEANQTAANLVIRKLQALHLLRIQTDGFLKTIQNPKSSATAKAKAEASYAMVHARFNGYLSELEGAAVITPRYPTNAQPMALLEVLKNVGEGKGNSKWATDAQVREKFTGSYPSYTIEVTEGSGLYNEWQMEVDQAQGMLKEAVRSFEQQGKQAGAFNPVIAQQFAQNQGRYFDGVPVVTGSFVRIAGKLSVYDQDGESIRFIDAKLQGRSNSLQYTSREGMEVFHKGDAGYEQCIQEAARLEDDAAQAGFAVNVFSKLVGEVASARKQPMLREYKTKDYLLPSPYFPIVIGESDAEKGAVMTRIFEAQKAIVKGVSWDSFVADSTLAMRKRGQEQLSDLVIDYAKAHGLKVTYKEVMSPQLGSDSGAVSMGLKAAMATNGGLAGALADTKDFQEIAQAAFDWMQAALPMLDLPTYLSGGEVNQESMTALLARYGYSIYSGFKARMQALLDAQAARMQPEAGSTPAATPAPVAPAAPASAAQDLVVVTGNTFAAREDLKAVAAEIAPRLDGWSIGSKSAAFDYGVNGWYIHRASWNEFVNRFPSVAESLNIDTKPEYARIEDVPAKQRTGGRRGGYRR